MTEPNADREIENTLNHRYIPITSVKSGALQTVAERVSCLTIQVVNVCFIGNREPADGWVLVDAGMPDSADTIQQAVREQFGEHSKPKAIVLTHGHFDHVGAVVELAEAWQVPVYANELELPYVTGRHSYPDPDASVEGGLLAKLSPLFPNEPVNLGKHVRGLPSDGTIPGLPEWRWIPTPGHSPGHVSLFRETDRTLIAGDAFITVRQDSLFKVIVQYEEICGPPRYFTTDWKAAKESVQRLEALKPAAAVTGHGVPVYGDELTQGLAKLVGQFDRVAVPDYGRYVDRMH